jgi:hypothetical protein
MNLRRLLTPGFLAVVASLGLHAGFFLLMFLTDSPGRVNAGEGPAAVDTCVWADEDSPAVDVSVAEAGQPNSGGEEEAEVVVRIMPPSEAVPEGATERGGGDPGEPSDSGGGPGPLAAPPRKESRLFPEARKARRVVYVIDRSLSMGLRGALGAACRELLTSLDELPEGTMFQVIFYNRDATWLTLNGQRTWLPVTEEVKREIAAHTASLRAEGATNHVQAVRLALSAQPDVIFLVTDADDIAPADVRGLTILNNRRVGIHTIELTSQQASTENHLLQLARANGGTHRIVDPETLVEAP